MINEMPLAASMNPMARISVSREKRENAREATHRPANDAGSAARAYNHGVGDCSGPTRLQ